MHQTVLGNPRQETLKIDMGIPKTVENHNRFEAIQTAYNNACAAANEGDVAMTAETLGFFSSSISELVFDRVTLDSFSLWLPNPSNATNALEGSGWFKRLGFKTNIGQILPYEKYSCEDRFSRTADMGVAVVGDSTKLLGFENYNNFPESISEDPAKIVWDNLFSALRGLGVKAVLSQFGPEDDSGDKKWLFQEAVGLVGDLPATSDDRGYFVATSGIGPSGPFKRYLRTNPYEFVDPANRSDDEIIATEVAVRLVPERIITEKR